MNDTAVSMLAPITMPGVQTRLTEDEEQVLLRVLREANALAIGTKGAPENDAFEAEFTEFLGCGDAVALNSCSSALELSAMMSGLGPGDEMIIPAHTFVATAVPFARTGATVKWADIDPGTRVVSAASIAALITDQTRVLVVVHLYGLPADMDAITAIARKHELIVVEDCAQAPGARYKGRRVGTFGDFGCFSFHSHKNIQTLGEGGMLAVRNPEHGELARRMRWMGNWPFEHDREKDWVPAGNNVVQPAPGRWPANFCLGEPSAAVGRRMLQRLDAINDQRRRQAERFIGGLRDFPELDFQHVPDGCEHAYHLMSARYDGESYGGRRDKLMTLMREKYGVKCFVQYWPLQNTELFGKFAFGEAEVPETARFYNNMISFPWWSDMNNDLLDDMAERTRQALQDLRGG